MAVDEATGRVLIAGRADNQLELIDPGTHGTPVPHEGPPPLVPDQSPDGSRGFVDTVCGPGLRRGGGFPLKPPGRGPEFTSRLPA